MTMPKESSVKKIQFNFTRHTVKVLKKLQESTGLKSEAEIIRNSICLYDWATKTIKEGGKIIVVTKDGKINEVILD